MKRNFFTRVMKSLFITLTVLGIGHSAFAIDIVGFTLATGTAGAATSGVAINYPGMGRTLTPVGLTGTGYSANGLTGAGWDNNGEDGFATNAYSTVGYLSTAVTGQIRGIVTGPKFLKAQYSLDGTTWVNVPDHLSYTDDNPNLIITTSFAAFKFRLPAECDNKTSVYVRWIMNGTTSIGEGTVTSAGTISMKAVVVQSELLSYPTSQSTQITIVSLTPTTITLGCTPGSGNRRYIAINTTNSFTTPTDDYLPSANATYSGTGEQVIYVGSGTVATVTLPSSLNTYWFRYYEFNQLNTLTRYCTVDATVSKNPKICALPNIHTPIHSFGLISATLGATIDAVSGDVGDIIDRGVFWDINPGITNNTPNFVQHASAASGTFTIDTEVDRGSVIYYRGYAENESGVILSSESSFDNTPIFTGTGTWETAARWSVNEVPGENGDATYGSLDDSPIINGICTLTVDNSVTDLTINSGKVLNINPAKSLTVGGTLTNNGGTAGLKLLSTLDGTGSLMHNTANVNATVQRYISGTSNDLTAKAYHLVSVPINSATYLSGVWLDSYLFTYLEGSNTWFNWDDPTGNVLNTPEGAMVYYKFGASKTYSITGQLNNGTYSPTVTYSGAGKGYNLVPNPYPSAINWEAASGWNTFNISGTIWGFNPTSKNYGSWNGSTGTESVTNIIPVGQAFFVVANGASPSLSMDNNVRLHDTKDFLKSGGTVPDVLHIIAAGNEGQNEIAIQFADEATINGNDNLDAIKFYSDMTVPQFSSFTSSDPSLLTINAIPYSEESAIVPLRFDMEFTGEITFTASGMESFENNSSIKLEDKQLAQLIDLRKNPVYTFNHTPTDSPERFALHFGGVLGLENPVTENLSTITVSGSTIYLNYPASNASIYASLFDVQGRLIKRMQLSNAGQDNFSISTDGIYILKLSLPSGTETHKIVVR